MDFSCLIDAIECSYEAVRNIYVELPEEKNPQVEFALMAFYAAVMHDVKKVMLLAEKNRGKAIRPIRKTFAERFAKFWNNFSPVFWLIMIIVGAWISGCLVGVLFLG